MNHQFTGAGINRGMTGMVFFTLLFVGGLSFPAPAQQISVTYVGYDTCDFSVFSTENPAVVRYNVYKDSAEVGLEFIVSLDPDGQWHSNTVELTPGVAYTLRVYAYHENGNNDLVRTTDPFTGGVPQGFLRRYDKWHLGDMNGGGVTLEEDGQLEIEGIAVNGTRITLTGHTRMHCNLAQFNNARILTSGATPLLRNEAKIVYRKSNFTQGEFRLKWGERGDDVEMQSCQFANCTLEIENADKVKVNECVLTGAQSTFKDATTLHVLSSQINQTFTASANELIFLQECASDDGYAPQITLGAPPDGAIELLDCEFRGDGGDMRFESNAEGSFTATHLELTSGDTSFRGNEVTLNNCFVLDSTLSIAGIPDEEGFGLVTVTNCAFDAVGRTPLSRISGPGLYFENTIFNRQYLQADYGEGENINLLFEDCLFLNTTDPDAFMENEEYDPEKEAAKLNQQYISSFAHGLVTVRDCRFFGGKGALEHSARPGYVTTAQGETVMERCLVEYAGGTTLSTNSDWTVADNNLFVGFNTGILTWGPGIILTSNTLTGVAGIAGDNGFSINFPMDMDFINNRVQELPEGTALHLTTEVPPISIVGLTVENCKQGVWVADNNSTPLLWFQGCRFSNCQEYSVHLDPCNRPVRFENCLFTGNAKPHVKTTNFEGATATPLVEIVACEFRDGGGFLFDTGNRLRQVHMVNCLVQDWSTRVFGQTLITSPLLLEGNIFRRIAGDIAVMVGKSNQIEVVNNTFSQCNNALYASYCSNTRILNNRFDLLTGIAIDSDGLTGAVINNNLVQTARIGIRAAGMNNSSFAQNTVTNCQGPEIMDGDGSAFYIWRFSSTQLVFEDNVATGNVFGFHCDPVSNLQFVRCRASDNEQAGFYFGSIYDDWYNPHTNCSLMNCQAAGNAIAGVVFRPNGSGPLIQGGAYSNSPILVDIQGTNDAILDGARFENAGQTGILVHDNTVGGRIENCDILHCKEGVALLKVKDLTLARNRLHQSDMTGIRILEGSGHLVSANRITDGEGNGIDEGRATNVTHTGNLLLNNLGTGLFRREAVAPGFIESNTCRNNFNGGIECNDLTAGTLLGNAFIENSSVGICLRNCTNLVIQRNQLIHNRDEGIYLASSAANRIFDNRFENKYNAVTSAPNQWNLDPPEAGINIIGGTKLGGNSWNSYMGDDLDGDGLGDTLTPHTDDDNITTGGDKHPLVLDYSILSPENPDRWPVLNEICPPTTDSVVREWVEIVNPGAFAQPMAGWKLVFNEGASTFTLPLTGPDWDGVLAPGAFLVVYLQGYEDTVAEDLDWPEGAGLLGGSWASVALLDAAGRERDYVIFGTYEGTGSPDKHRWIEAPSAKHSGIKPLASGGVPAPVLPKPAPGQSLGRDKDSFDMDLPFDWDPMGGYHAGAPTPGRANIEIPEPSKAAYFMVY